MPFTSTFKNTMLGQVPSPVYASLHTAAPSQGTPAEVTGGGYVRKAVSLTVASAGVRSGTGLPVTFDVPAATTVTHVGYWDSLSGGTLIASFDFPNDETFGNAGKADLTSATFTISDVVGG